MKKLYETVEMEVIYMDEMDVITTSGGRLDDDELPPVPVS